MELVVEELEDELDIDETWLELEDVLTKLLLEEFKDDEDEDIEEDDEPSSTFSLTRSQSILGPPLADAEVARITLVPAISCTTMLWVVQVFHAPVGIKSRLAVTSCPLSLTLNGRSVVVPFANLKVISTGPWLEAATDHSIWLSLTLS